LTQNVDPDLDAMDAFNEVRFRQKVDTALTRVRTILDNEKKPLYAENVPHECAPLISGLEL
jgi:hypothetical protein